MKRFALSLILLLPLAVSPARAAIGTPVSLGSTSDASAASTRLINSATVPAGAMIIVFMADSEGVALGPPSPATPVSDSAGNTYVAGTAFGHDNNNLKLRAYYALNATALSGGTITATFGTADPILKTVHAAYVTGVATTSAADSQASAFATSASPSAATGLLAQADEIVFGMAGVESGSSVTFTEASGFTNLSRTAVSDLVNLAYKTVSATSAVTYAPTMDGSRHWGAGVWSFKAAAGGGAVVCRGALLGVGC